MTAVSEVIAEANGLLLGGVKETFTTLDTAVNTSVTSWVLDPGLEHVEAGDTLQADEEEVLVSAWDHQTNTATVVRARNGTIAAAHDVGDLVTHNPLVGAGTWFKHLCNELRSLSSPQKGLYKVSPVEITYNGARVGYDLAGVTDLEDIIDVQAEQPGGHGDWVAVTHRDWALQRNHDAGDFASGYALRFRGGALNPGRAIRVIYRGPFTLPTVYTDVVETTCGIPPTAVDLLAIGMVIRAVESQEISRNLLRLQPTRKLGDVPPGALNQAAAGLRTRHQERVSEERSRLIRKYGM